MKRNEIDIQALVIACNKMLDEYDKAHLFSDRWGVRIAMGRTEIPSDPEIDAIIDAALEGLKW